MNPKLLYNVSKILNWVSPILLLMCSTLLSEEAISPYQIYIVLGYGLYAFMKGMYKSAGRGRMTYEIWIFVGLLISEYILLTDEVTIWETAFLVCYTNESLFIRVLLTIICIITILSKAFTLIYETKEYRANADEREELRLEYDVECATLLVEKARSGEELRQAEMKLERAKLKREQYYRNKK